MYKRQALVRVVILILVIYLVRYLVVLVAQLKALTHKPIKEQIFTTIFRPSLYKRQPKA